MARLTTFTEVSLTGLQAGPSAADLAITGTAYFDNLSVTAVPEPSSFLLIGLVMFGFLARRNVASFGSLVPTRKLASLLGLVALLLVIPAADVSAARAVRVNPFAARRVRTRNFLARLFAPAPRVVVASTPLPPPNEETVSDEGASSTPASLNASGSSQIINVVPTFRPPTRSPFRPPVRGGFR